MPENKNQHFVPRFYLSNFSFDGGGRTNLVRVDGLKAIPRVGLAGQCQDDYFYGKDLKMEKALGVIEGASRKVIADILRTGQLPPSGTAADAIFRTFICLQWIRTREFSDTFDLGLDQMLKAKLRDEFKAKGYTEEDLADAKIRRSEGPQESVALGMDFLPFFWDLEAKLILANDLGEFVTSDNPVVLLNPHYLGRFDGGVTGIALAGTVILLPLSPECLVVLHDKQCYRVGVPGCARVPLGSITDLVALNNHQFLHADQCVYHRSVGFGSDHARAFSEVAPLRLIERQKLGETRLPDGSTLLHSFAQAVAYQPIFAFIKVLRHRRHETTRVDQIPPRDYALSKHFETYTTSVREKGAPRGFAAYIANVAKTVLSDAEIAAVEAAIAATRSKR